MADFCRCALATGKTKRRLVSPNLDFPPKRGIGRHQRGPPGLYQTFNRKRLGVEFGYHDDRNLWKWRTCLDVDRHAKWWEDRKGEKSADRGQGCESPEGTLAPFGSGGEARGGRADDKISPVQFRR
ncbi:hypothetical protein Bbelb_026870 [Branchiostoma belcheri]|nr:hypothetical protein Bbelb_026870 [Branchiostoma belcheri]